MPLCGPCFYKISMGKNPSCNSCHKLISNVRLTQAVFPGGTEKSEATLDHPVQVTFQCRGAPGGPTTLQQEGACVLFIYDSDTGQWFPCNMEWNEANSQWETRATIQNNVVKYPLFFWLNIYIHFRSLINEVFQGLCEGGRYSK